MTRCWLRNKRNTGKIRYFHLEHNGHDRIFISRLPLSSPKNEIISWRYLCIGIFQSHRERLVVEYIYWQQWKLLFTILYWLSGQSHAKHELLIEWALALWKRNGKCLRKNFLAHSSVLTSIDLHKMRKQKTFIEPSMEDGMDHVELPFGV